MQAECPMDWDSLHEFLLQCVCLCVRDLFISLGLIWVIQPQACDISDLLVLVSFQSQPGLLGGAMVGKKDPECLCVPGPGVLQSEWKKPPSKVI
jgi:hypothetical protein